MKMHEYKPFAEFKNGNTIISGVDNFDLAKRSTAVRHSDGPPCPTGAGAELPSADILR